jgi:hypothetical protein
MFPCPSFFFPAFFAGRLLLLVLLFFPPTPISPHFFSPFHILYHLYHIKNNLQNDAKLLENYEKLAFSQKGGIIRMEDTTMATCYCDGCREVGPKCERCADALLRAHGYLPDGTPLSFAPIEEQAIHNRQMLEECNPRRWVSLTDPIAREARLCTTATDTGI